MSARESVVIVGGGISALAAAWELTGGANGPTRATPRVEIIESRDRLGGSVESGPFAGREVDRGADGFLARRPEAVDLVHELGIADDLEPIAASGAWLYLDGRLDPLPSGLVLGVPTSATSLRSLRGLSRRARLSAWRDEHFPRSFSVADDATIGAIVRAKLGDEIADMVVEPMIGGIQAGRINDLSAASVFPALLTAAQSGGSLMRALRPPAPEASSPSPAEVAPAFMTLRQGVGSLPRELERQLRARGVVVTLCTPVTALRRTPTSFYAWEVDTATTTTPANVVIVTTPPHATAKLLGSLDPAFEALGDVASAGAAMVTFAVPRTSLTLPASGTGVLVPLGTPARDSRDGTLLVTAITFLDRKWPHLADEETVLVRAHVGRSDDERASALSDDELRARVTRDLAQILGGFPTLGEQLVVRWPQALPQYRVGHATLVAQARRAAAALSLTLAGNTYDGVGIPASVGSGRRAAREARTLLADR